MNPKSILFVCMGNICRSPAGEGVMLHQLQQANIQDIHIDSAGTHGYHIGKPADDRMRKAATNRGLTLTHRARQFSVEDFDKFDLILVMDRDNLANVRRLDPQHQYHDKVRLFAEFCQRHNVTEIPDPYYGGDEGFEEVLNMMEDGCSQLVEQLKTSRD